MRSESIYKNYSAYINSALLACHASFDESGFRQKDLKFFIELFTNWMDSRFDGPGLEIKNTQVQRILEDLKKENLLKKTVKNQRPHYRFTPIGLLEIASRFVSVDLTKELEDFFFLYHFSKLYSEKLFNLVSKEKGFLPPSYEIELRHLLKTDNILERQKKQLALEIEKLEDRINEAFKMSEMGERLKRQHIPLDEIVKKVSSTYPYQLNSQRPMGMLFNTLSADVKLFELTTAPKYRAQTLWQPLLSHYKNYLGILETL